jgi:carbamoyl-phosphate synthase large subunit
MLGETVRSLGLDRRHVVPYFGVKEAVMPFEKFPEVDPVLGPEMRSTGEVLGLADTFGLAYFKSQEAVGSPLPVTKGKLLVSLSEKPDDAVAAIRKFAEIGFEIVGTDGTIAFLKSKGVEGSVIAKIGEGRPNVLDAIKNREVKLIVNTPSGRRDARADDCRIRQAAIKYKIPYLTTIAAARAASEGIVAAMNGCGEVRSLQSYHSSIGS